MLVDVLLKCFFILKIVINICYRLCLIISVHNLITLLIVTSYVFITLHDSVNICNLISIVVIIFVFVMVVLFGTCLISGQNSFFLNDFELIIFILSTSGNFSSFCCFSNNGFKIIIDRIILEIVVCSFSFSCFTQLLQSLIH